LIYYAITDAPNGRKVDQLYTAIIPNFGSGSNFGNIEEGWYLAIFNNTNNSYILYQEFQICLRILMLLL
jgi:hypothetical protein